MPTSTTTPPFLARFYSPTSPIPDPEGRTLASILNYSDANLEYEHSYIQILFPLPEGSLFNYSAPIIDLATFTIFRSSDPLRSNLLRSWQRMLAFYGLSYDASSPAGSKVQLSREFDRRAKNWVTPFNHNHLRITRILRSLRVLGCGEEAEEFWSGLQLVKEAKPGRIGARSFMYWQRALQRPLWVAPDEYVVPEQGRGWLWDWEQQQQRQETSHVSGEKQEEVGAAGEETLQR